MARKMKDSGIQWIGEIPEGWETTRIGGLYSLRNTKVSDIDYPPLSVTMKGIMPQLETAAKTNDHNNRKLVKKDDFVINSRSDRRGSCGISTLDGSVSLINIVLSPNEMMNPEYYNGVFTNPSFSDEFYKWGNGIVDDLWTTNWNKMKNINVPHPDLETQKIIANYLNDKVSSIESLLIEINKEIENLENYKKSVITEAVTKGLNKNVEMKDSGIEWIGEIPEHWKITRIKNSANIYGRIGYRGYTHNDIVEEGMGAVSLSPSNMHNGEIKYDNNTFISWNKYEESPEIKVRVGDIVMVKTGSSYGKVSLVEKLNYKSTINPQLIIVKIKNIGNRYLFYCMNSNYFNYQVEMSVTGGTIPTMSQEKINNFYITLPEIKEQNEIVEYLDQKCKIINDSISIKKQQLETLEEYKKSLIYEYVTGKKEVELG